MLNGWMLVALLYAALIVLFVVMECKVYTVGGATFKWVEYLFKKFNLQRINW